jgi:hypothetical protein
MSDVVRNLHEATFSEIKAELGLTHNPGEVFYRSEGNPVLFRGEHVSADALRHALLHDYGEGAYGANVPSATALYAGREHIPNFGVAAYALHDVPNELITVRRSGINVDRGNELLVFFKPPLLVRVGNWYSYRYAREEQDIPEYWALLRSETAKEHIKKAQKIAWLGKTTLGPSRWTDAA